MNGSDIGRLKVSRYPGEWIDIGEDVRIYFTEVEGKRVYVSVQAPKSIKIHFNKKSDRKSE